MPRRRKLSPEEHELWRKVAGAANRLHPETPPAPVPAEPLPLPTVRAPRPEPEGSVPPATPKREVRVRLDLAPDPSTGPGGAPLMDRRRFEKMRRGRLEPEARLDLHGMTSERAHGALRAFILRAHADGLRLVLIITGKGRVGDAFAMAPQRHGILRHSLPHWLAAPPLGGKVLQITPAHLRHGGAGAFYVYLRRAR